MAAAEGREKERQFITECIHLYRDLPVLWNVKNQQYRNRNKKNMAYQVLVGKYREMYPTATREDVKKKFNILRTNYRKEYKRCVESAKSGASPNSMYQPSLWYFDEFSFLHDQEDGVSDSESSSTDNVPVPPNYVFVRGNAEQSYEDKSSPLEDTNHWRNLEKTSQEHQVKRPRRDPSDDDDDPFNLPSQHSGVKDDFHFWALACAADLRNMERKQQIYAKRAIAEILMNGQLGRLHRDSVTVNE